MSAQTLTDNRQALQAAYADSEMLYPAPAAPLAVARVGEHGATAFDILSDLATAAEFGVAGTPQRAYAVAKRAIDIVLSLAGLILMSPLLIAAAVAVKLYDGGPVIFSQDRVGANGRIFRCFKFRSMVINAESLQRRLQQQSQHADPRTFKMANDPRITPVGRWLRRFSIDEFPQIFNVLLGDMSIVGPRPPLPGEVELYSPGDLRRLTVKPGLTCIWQVSGRSRLAFPEQVKMDLEYIENRSLVNDFRIILRTIPAVLSGDGAA